MQSAPKPAVADLFGQEQERDEQSPENRHLFFGRNVIVKLESDTLSDATHEKLITCKAFSDSVSESARQALPQVVEGTGVVRPKQRSAIGAADLGCSRLF
jgi:hypothetical protein